MTIIEAIHKTDALMHNTYSQPDKVGWLSNLDWKIKTEIIDTHVSDHIEFSGYTEQTDINTVLLVPAPFDEMYLRWMEAQIAYHNGEYKKYNAAIILFNTAYTAYANFYNRNHASAAKGRRFLF